ncbi:MAG TPA: hypothetical protein VMW34_01590 [Anaerolineales bacterium]|nr:hypothetical protein [Anaerolineales bacterium]
MSSSGQASRGKQTFSRWRSALKSRQVAGSTTAALPVAAEVT